MFGSDVLEVAMGIMFVYFVLALICSAISEWISSLVSLRARTLEASLQNLLNGKSSGDPDFAKIVYAHPLIRALHTSGKPSYIPSQTFVTALLDTLTVVADVDRSSSPPTHRNFRDAIAKLPQGNLQHALLVHFDEAEKDLAKARINIEQWYDHVMDRTSGWYKRRAQIIIVVLAFLSSVALNADTLAIAGSLHRGAVLRSAVTAVAAREVGNVATASGNTTSLSQVRQIQDDINGLDLPMGWSSSRAFPTTVWEWLSKVTGILLTTAAVSLGAPFWFDMLNKITNLRLSGDVKR